MVSDGIISKIITPLQEEFIQIFAESFMKETFFLTGGTALSAFYLHHRLSDDMDFFTEEEGQVPRVLPQIQKIATLLRGQLEVRRNFRSYLEFFINRGKETLRCDFAMDSPYRLKPKIFNEEYGIFIDNAIDISYNKLSALYDRSDPKDFVDIFFIHKVILPFEKLVEKAKRKHVGLDNYWLAISLAKIEDFNLLPKMLKPVQLDELKHFFKEKTKWLMKK